MRLIRKSSPEGGVCEGVLKLAAMFAKKKKEILPMEKTEVGTKTSLDCWKRVGKPFRLRSEIGGPSVWGGEKECSAGSHELR
jgi:hypothetical protein